MTGAFFIPGAYVADLFSPGEFKGPEVDELISDYWRDMERTRRNAETSSMVISGQDTFTLPETFTIAGADQYIAELPHPRTMPSRVLQEVISDRPSLNIPLGPKGLGITGQRLTTKVEQPLNAICEDRRAGFQWPRACALMTFEGFCASVTVLDPADWEKRTPSQWEDGHPGDYRDWDTLSQDEKDKKQFKRRYRVDERGRHEGDDNYSGKVDNGRAGRMAALDRDVFRARNIPIRHRAIGIRQCAPIFDGDYETVGGLLISQEFSESSLRRHFQFGDAGLATPTGSNSQDGTGRTGTSSARRTMTRLEAWLYDEDMVPWVVYCVKGAHAVETTWKHGPGQGQYAAINLKERFGLDRLPISWRFGLGNPGEINADMRAMGLIEPFYRGWRSARAKMTAMNVACMWMGFPALIEESDQPIALGLDEQEPSTPDILPMKITQARPGTKLRALEVQAFSPLVLEAIQLELGANADESPGKSNKDQSGFSQSLAAAFEQLAMSTVRTGLDELYEDHGSYVLEAGKRMPEQGERSKGGQKYAPIMVFRSSDVPTSDSSDKPHNEPMMLDPDTIDETFTTKATHKQSMSIPEDQQAMEKVARGLMTTRTYLEKSGENAPETVVLEVESERQRADEEYKKTVLWPLVREIQGAEELKEIKAGQAAGLADEAGLAAGLDVGVAPALPPGALPALPQGNPGVPVDGSVTGMAAPQYGQNALAGTVAGPGMVGPINTAVAAGGVIPPNLPTGGPV